MVFVRAYTILAEAVTFCVQERVLLEKLLLSGFVPDVAVFIDGLNDLVLLEPARTKDLRRFMEEAESTLIPKTRQGTSSDESPGGNVPIARCRRHQLSEGL